MKTIVVFNLPDEGLRYCSLDELTMAPQRGSRYILNRKVYEVEQPIEVLGRHADGTRKGSYEMLLELLTALDGNPVTVLANLAKMENLGDPAESAQKSPGGVILSMPTDSFDKDAKVVVVNAKLLKKLPEKVLDIDPSLLSQLIGQPGIAAITAAAGEGGGEKSGG